MQITDAFWDTRSLNKKTLELAIDRDDAPEDITNALAQAEADGYEYIVAKAAPGNLRLNQLLEENGFTFAECSLEVLIHLRTFTMPKLAQRFADDITYDVATTDSRARIYDEIRCGIFDTDRIALDGHFPEGVAATRYVNWIEDELERGADLYHVFFRGDEVGFFVFKETVPGVEANPFLAGLYDKYKSSGLGMNVVVGVETLEAQRRGLKRVRSHVSSNNVAVLNLYEYMGYHVSDIQNVFVRHTD